MKKRLILLILLFSILLSLNNLNAEVVDSTKKLIDTSINPETGQIKKIEDLNKNFESFKKVEQNKSYFNQEMSVILHKIPVLGSFLFYTKQIFSILNPLWNLLFGIPFSWSWQFVLLFLLYIILFKLIYDITEAFSEFNFFIRFLLAFTITSIASISGALRHTVNSLKFAVVDFWLGTLIFIIGIIIIVVLDRLMTGLGKNSKEIAKQEEKQRREEIERISAETKERELKKTLKSTKP